MSKLMTLTEAQVRDPANISSPAGLAGVLLRPDDQLAMRGKVMGRRLGEATTTTKITRPSGA